MNLSVSNLNVIFIGLGFLLSSFYIFPSGLPQLAHIFLIFSVLIFIFYNNKIIISDSKYLILFVIYSTLINILFYYYRMDFSFVVSIIYWIFNLLLFLALVSFSLLNVNKFFEILRWIITISLVLNFIIWITGAGRYDFSPRYNGYFNDPNQMAFWVLCSCAIGLILFKNLKIKIFIYSISIFLILLTMSRSATLGFLILTLGFIFQYKKRLDFKILFSLISLLFAIASFFILLKFGFLDNIITRFSEGVEQNDDQTSSRGFDVLINFPEYLLFGAGQGAYYLYSSTGNEIHSTWFGILFYYGIIGFFLFFFFLFNIFKKLNSSEKIIFLAPMCYGFFTYNARTLVFWFLVAVFLLYSKHREQL
jgi:hypothetical protein